jgi:hypothetical protein
VPLTNAEPEHEPALPRGLDPERRRLSSETHAGHAAYRREQPLARGVVVAREAGDQRLAHVGAGDARVVGEAGIGAQPERPRQAVARAADRVRERRADDAGAVQLHEPAREVALERLPKRIGGPVGIERRQRMAREPQRRGARRSVPRCTTGERRQRRECEQKQNAAPRGPGHWSRIIGWTRAADECGVRVAAVPPTSAACAC